MAAQTGGEVERPRAVKAAGAAVEGAASRGSGVVLGEDEASTYSLFAKGMREERLRQTAEQRNRGGPPLLYDKEAMQKYWRSKPSELNQRWLTFLSVSTPFVTKCVQEFAAGRLLTNDDSIRTLSRIAREGMEQLGPSYVKLGQMMSIRPDIIPQAAQAELQRLQDSVRPFPSDIARGIIEEELGCSIDVVFSEFGEEPVAAASLAQVFRARLRESGKAVAVKVQRPDALSTVSKDLYVLQRAVGVYQGVIERWTNQRTDYVALLDTFAEGFYTELDFLNEAKNQVVFRENIVPRTKGSVYVPKVYMEYCSRRVLVSEWVDGSKLTDATGQELRDLTAIGQQCFLEQLLEKPGLFHCDPHAGNILKVARPEDLEHPLGANAKICLIDYGLVTTIPEKDRVTIIRGIVHMANRDWDAVTQDCVELGFLPENVDRSRVTPVLKRVLAPYIFQGGGAKAFLGPEGNLSSPSFQALARDLGAVSVEIPFSIPPYFALLARSIAVLEGIALAGDPDYRIVMSSYPYVARRLLRDSSESESFRMALNEILYASSADSVGGAKQRLNPRRLLVLLNNALGKVAESKFAAADGAYATGGGAFVDLDALPQDEAPLSELINLILSDSAQGIRAALLDEVVVAIDLALRQLARQSSTWFAESLQPPRLPGPLSFFTPRLPKLIPNSISDAALNRIAPALMPEEQVYLNDLVLLAFDLLELDGDPDTVLASPIQSLNVLRKLATRLSVGGRVSATTSQAEQQELVRTLSDLGRQFLTPGSGSSEDQARANTLREMTQIVSSRLLEIQRNRVLGASTSNSVPTPSRR